MAYTACWMQRRRSLPSWSIRATSATPETGRVSCYLEARDFYAERFTRTLADPFFERLRRRIPVGFTIDDHDYGQQNNASPAQIPNWAVPLWNQFHADPSDLGYNEFRFGDVQCVTLDGRRYADPVTDPDTPQKTKLGQVQRAWLESLLSNTNAGLVVVYSADAFASRRNLDCFVFGWPDEYRRLMTAFMGLQLRGTRVVILSGDAHGLRIHRHPDPADRPGLTGSRWSSSSARASRRTRGLCRRLTMRRSTARGSS